MAAQPDDLDAIRTIVSTLESFDASNRDRIVRHALEKLGMKLPPAQLSQPSQPRSEDVMLYNPKNRS